MAVLDLKVWMDQEGNILFQHYQKPMASKKAIQAKSAHSISCKKSTHVQELVRRMLNTSCRLDWNDYTVPILTEYMRRMREAGYSQNYRKNTLSHAFRIYDKMKNDDENGTRPIYRPANWNIVERREEKTKKKRNWSSKGGYIAPIIIPATPNVVK